uniref:Transcription initiation factor IIF subunit alpha n=1 Tax=Ciona savignyi TaxID=51511 RepID=H2YGQ5_CIOSA
HVDEYIVHVPKNLPKKFNVMRFNAGDKVDIRKWSEASLVRDMSGKKVYEQEEVYPEFGAGSEYGRKQREEARKLKYGMRKKKFVLENQPWNLTVTTLVKKDFLGKKEGGIGEGSMYFVFTQRPDFTFEAYPVDDWHNFNRKIRHRTLTDEEAEAAWDKRDKIVNHLNYMARKRLHLNDDDEGADDEGGMKSKTKTVIRKIKKEDNDLVIHDDEDLDLYMSGSSSEENDSGVEKKKKNKAKVNKKKEDSDKEQEEAVEDSDDGEHEGTEVLYASDVSSDESVEANDSKVAPHGIDELDDSSSDEDEEDDKKEKEQDKGSGLSKRPKEGSGSSGDSESDLEDEDSLSQSALFMQRKKTPTKDKGGKSSKGSSRSSTPTTESAGGQTSKSDLQNVKKKLESGRQSPLASSMLGKRGASRYSGSTSPTKDIGQHGITEEAVRKYLTHKPITTKDLLKKFKKKKTGLSSEQIVEKVAKILRKLNPQKIQTNGKMHLFLRD